MNRIAAVALFALVALVPARSTRAAPAAIRAQRPNPVLEGFRLDYVHPLKGADGGVASLAPLGDAAIGAAARDGSYLHYKRRDDLGGFLPAPVGGTALVGDGRPVVGGRFPAQLPLFRRNAGGTSSFAVAHGGPGGAGGPENGKQPVPGLGTPVPTPPPTSGPVPPPANQGFGGKPARGSGTGTTTTTTTTTTTRPKPPPTRPTTTTTTPTPPVTTSTTTTTTTVITTPGGGGSTGTTVTTVTTPPPAPVECGAAGLSILSVQNGCRIDAVNMGPGDAATETVTVTNTSASTYTLSFKATGTHNSLWDDLKLAIFEQGNPAPTPLPPLDDWTGQFNDLTTLAPGQSITYVIELALPLSAGNDDQGLAAIVHFVWHASG